MSRAVRLVVFALLAACAWSATTVTDTVAERARVDLDCADVTVVEAPYPRFRAEGCGRELSYGCTVRFRYAPVCTPELPP